MPAIGRPLGSGGSGSAGEPGSVPALTPAADPGGPWALRAVVPGDAEEIARLERVLFPDEAWDLDSVREEISHPSRRYCAAVAARGGAILGYAGIMALADTADLHTIGTVRESDGIGQALLAWCEDAAWEEGAERLLLEVRVDNDRARAFYARAGFEELAIRRGYYRTATGPIDAVVMSKTLAGLGD